jgi:hypothetical protein
MAVTVTAVSPGSGPQAGGTVITVTGTGFAGCDPRLFLHWPGDQNVYPCQGLTQTDTQMTATTPNMVGHPSGAYDCGVYELGGGYHFLSLSFVVGTGPTGTPNGQWDQPAWDQSMWNAVQFPTGAGWGYDWQVWFQYGGALVWDMTASVVEARWSSDSYTTGDGTFRGDIQPGTLALQVHDPAHKAETLSKLGTIWLRYAPAKLTWGFYLDTVTRQLVAPGDPTAADVVIQGSLWPVRLNTDCLHSFTRPAERCDTRLGAIAAFLNQNTDLQLPRYQANIAADSHVAPAVVATSWGATVSPAALSLIRTAAADGVAWVSSTVDGAGIGQFTLNYARWETAPRRDLAASDVVAGIPYDSSMDTIITAVEWDGTGPDGTQITNTTGTGNMFTYGFVKVQMRVLANLAPGQADQAAVTATGNNLVQVHSDPTVSKLSTVTCTSGARTKAGGGAGPPWNPAAHVWNPSEVLHWVPPAGQAWGFTTYRVVKTAHRLRAAAWDSAHTVEGYTPASPLPA